MEPALAQVSGLRSLAPAKINATKRVPYLSDTSPSTRRYACSLCKKSYSKLSTLGQHKKYKHPLENGKTIRFWCEHCGETFQRPEGPKVHISKSRCPVLRSRLAHQGSLPSFAGSETAASRTLDTSPPTSHNDGKLPVNFAQVHGGKPAKTFQPIKGFVEVPIAGSSQCSPASDSTTDWIALRTLTRFHRVVHQLFQICKVHSKELQVPRIVRDFGDMKRGFEASREALQLRATDPVALQAWFSLWINGNLPMCGTPRRSCRYLFPPAFDLPAPQDLEYLIWSQIRDKRRLCVLESFRNTHRKLTDNNSTPKRMDMVASDVDESAFWSLLRHTTDFKHAWKDGMGAARHILRGTLPRKLHSVLGVAQVASAIRAAVCDVDSPIASKNKFLADLGRWRQLLPSDSHTAFDYYADVMWDDRPCSDLAWREPHDAETLVYFQDQVAEMLALIDCSSSERTTSEQTPRSPDIISKASDIATTLPTLPNPVPDQVQFVKTMSAELPDQDACMPATLGEIVLYTAGAIFALILTFLLRTF
jgi:hypothetical protein